MPLIIRGLMVIPLQNKKRGNGVKIECQELAFNVGFQ
jgi:hypothetical protein